MGKEIKVRIIMRYNSTEGWTALSGGDSVLAKGEIGLEYISGSALPKMKIGNGLLSWDNLPYFETSLPEKFTWGKLRGTTLQTTSSTTENLNLSKPGFTDVVNIVTLNKNFDKIDNSYSIHSIEMKNLGERITNLTSLIPTLPSSDGDLRAEIETARTINGQSYKSLSEALDALNLDLQNFKNKINKIIEELVFPQGLELNSQGQIYLIDKEGNQIGTAVTVKDAALELQVKTLDSNVNILTSQVKNNITNISLLQEKVEELPKLAPNNLIYEDNKLYLAIDDERLEDSVVEITGGGGGSGLITSFELTLTAPIRNISKPVGDQVILSFFYSSVDKEDNTINDGPGSGEITKDGIQQTTFLVQQGENTLDVTKFLVDGKNTLKLKVTNSEGSSKTIQFNIKLLTLSIESDFPKMGFYNLEQQPIPYLVQSEAEKTVHFILTKQDAKPGEQYYEPTTIDTEDWGPGNISSQFYLNRLPSGSYLLQIYATSGEQDSIVTSNIISIGMIWYTEKDTAPFIVMNAEQNTVTQGELITISYLIYHPNNETPNATFSILPENSLYPPNTVTGINRTEKKWDVQRYPVGEITFQITCENVSNSITVKVEESEIELELFRDSMIFEFDPTGRTNQNSANQWSYEDIQATFDGIDWGDLDGWKTINEQTALRLLPGGSMSIPFYPFSEEISNSGYTIELELSTQNVTDYEALIIDVFDEESASQRGLRVYSQSIDFKSENNLISYQFKEEERIRITFTIEQKNTTRLITLYINGIACAVKQYNNDNFMQNIPSMLNVGAEKSGIDLYFIRFYTRALDMEQQLNNFAVERSTFLERVEVKKRNDILNSSHGGILSKMITINSLKGSVPYIIMECPKLPANKETDKFSGMRMVFVDPANPSRSFTAENCTFSVQGTSSAGYPVKNFKIKLDKKQGITYTENQKQSPEGFYFEGKGKSQPTRVFCLKADYASSENANNVMLVDYYNQTSPYRNVAQQYQVDNGMPETVRHGIHGEPIVLFWRNTNTNEIYFQGKYNFNDDKDSEAVFGYVDVLPEDKYNIQCWEFRNNNMDLCLFKHKMSDGDKAWFDTVTNDGETAPAWELCFERRFPEQEDSTSDAELAALRRMVDWVASTRRENANPEIKISEEGTVYKTLDTMPKAGKIYYIDESCTQVFDLTPSPSIKLYDSDIEIVWDTFKNYFIPALKDIFTKEEDYFRGYVFLKNEDLTWRLIYFTYSDEGTEIENLVLNNISNLNTWGISGFKEDQSTIVFDYYEYVPWREILYEKHTHDTVDYRLAKFKNEFEDYFILDAMAYYYVFTETVLLMDNRAKNMFLVCFDTDLEPIIENGETKYIQHAPGTYGHWAPTPYDMDSALGINNEGELAFSYHLEDTGEDGQVFTGQDSTLWNNFRDCFQKEIASMYQAIRAQAGTTNGTMPFSFESLSTKMNNHQSAWAEIIWNIDQRIKYLQPFYEGTNHLAMAQGDKRAQRLFWLYNAFKYRDSKYSAGDALTNAILFRLYGQGTFNIKPFSHIYARVKFGNALDIKQRALRNQIAKISTEGISSIYDLETYIYSADRISSLGDLSDFKIGLCNFAYASKLEEILLGKEEEGYVNEYLKNLTLGASTVLREIDISNCINLTTDIDASQCPCLESFKAHGSNISNVSFARGARLKTCRIPKSMTSISLLDLHYLTEKRINEKGEEIGLDIEKENDSYKLFKIRIENSNQIPFYDLVMNSPGLVYLRLTDVNWTTSLSIFQKFYNTIKNLKGLDINGGEEKDSRAVFTGKVYLPNDEISDDFVKELNRVFPQLTIVAKGISKFVMTYVDFENNIENPLYQYVANENSIPVDPTDPNIDTNGTILSRLNEKPAEDKSGDGEIDTKYKFARWSNLPEKVTSSLIITPYYKEIYLVKFFNTNKIDLFSEVQWVTENEEAKDPITTENKTPPTKDFTAQYGYTFKEWDKSLKNIIGPTNFYPTFTEKVNTYTVHFYTNLQKPLAEQTISYGEYASDISQTQNIYYYIGANPDKPSNLHSFKNWETNTLGIQGLRITPSQYQTEPINFIATFIFNGSINDVSWSEIAESAYSGMISDYSIGSTKDIYVTKDGINYTIPMELVSINFDDLTTSNANYNGGSNKAAYTFLAKSIPWESRINNSDKNFIDPETGEQYSGPTAGGWYNSDLRQWSNGTFLNLLNNENNPGLIESIKEVKKIGDRGMATPWSSDFVHRLLTSNDKIWIPSTTELSTSESSTTYNLSDQQSSQYLEDEFGNKTYLPYEWFSNNQTRIKEMNGTATKYFTRTHNEGLTHRFLIITETGETSNEIADTPLGYVFGFCI